LFSASLAIYVSLVVDVYFADFIVFAGKPYETISVSGPVYVFEDIFVSLTIFLQLL
jgi:hypothetical protein